MITGFDWDPATNFLWATSNGRELLYPDQDNRPDDTLLFIPAPGLDFGFPYCHWYVALEPCNKPGAQQDACKFAVNSPLCMQIAVNSPLCMLCCKLMMTILI